jgi:hypothetical protein
MDPPKTPEKGGLRIGFRNRVSMYILVGRQVWLVETRFLGCPVVAPIAPIAPIRKNFEELPKNYQ